ncbi:MAG: hypothetical protein AAGA56_00360 [Myxococcota bacterium]
MPVVLALLAIGLVALIGSAIRGHQRKISAAWAEAARRLVGRYDPKSGPWYRRSKRIDASLRDQDVSIDHYTVSTGNTTITYTRGGAAVAFAGDFELRVYPKGFWANLGEALGTQDVKTGDPSFDDAFMVKANDEARAQAWLTPAVRAAIETAEGYRFTLKKGQLKAEYATLESDPDRLVRLARATAVVARRGRDLRSFWLAEAKAREATVEQAAPDRLRIFVEDNTVPVRIETKAVGGPTRIIARRMSRDGEPFTLDVHGDDLVAASEDPTATRRRITPELDRRIRALGPRRIVADGDVLVVEADGIEGDASRLEEAMAVAEALAAADPRAGYR